MKKRLNNSFLVNIAVLASGSFIAQGIGALTIPVLTRIYTPEDLGLYTYIISIAAIFLSVVNTRYDVSIVTEPEERNVYPLIKLSLIVGGIVTIIASIGGYVFFSFKGMPGYLSIYLFVIIATDAINNVLTAYNNRRKEYKVISSVYVLRTGTQNIGAILLGILSRSIHCLLLPYAIGQLLGIKRQMKPLQKYWREVISVPANKVKEVAFKHKKQFYFSTPALLANSLSYSIITIFIEMLYGMTQVGFYSISVRLLGLPLALIGGNVSKVFLEQASAEYNEHKHFSYSFKKTFILLLIIAIPMVLVLTLLATPICTFVFGKEWAVAGKYIAILAPMFGIRFITSAMSPAFVIINRQGLELILQMVFLVCGVLSYTISQIYHLEIIDFVTLISATFSVAYLIYFLAIYKYSKKIN